MEIARVGFLGAGLIARQHGRGLAGHEQAEIVACYDQDLERSTSFVADFGGAVASGPAEVIDRSDAVYVCTYTASHVELVADIVRSGRAVFCEKPLATDFDSVAEIADVVRRSGVVNQVGFVLRRAPAFRWLHHQLTSPNIDTGRVMAIVFRDDQYLPTQGAYGSTWRAEKSHAGAGTLLEHSIHDLDLLQWLVGPISAVQATTSFFHELDGIEDIASVQMTTASGASISLVSVWHDLLDRPSDRRVEVFCERAYFAVDGDRTGPVRWTFPDSSGSMSGLALTDHAASIDGLRVNADVAFVDSVLAGTEAYPNFGTALSAHYLCDAAYESAGRSGVPVDVAESGSSSGS